MKITLKNLMWIQIFLLFTVRFIISISNFKYIAYISDVVTIFMGILIIKHYKKNKINFIILYFILNVIFWILSFICNERSTILLFLTMIREIGRFYIIFLAAQVCLKKQEYEKIFKIFDIVIFVHFVFILIQLYVIKVQKIDSVGGIFGIQYGYGNSSSHALCIFSLVISLYKYFKEEEPLHKFIIKLGIILTIGMLTEMKALIFEMVVIIILFFLFNMKIKIKNLIFISCLTVATLFFMSYIEKIYNINIFSISKINSYINSGYGNSRDGIGRIGGYEYVYNKCFEQKIFPTIIGYGFGASTSQYTYELYGAINLEYFTYAKMFYDTGIIGTILYFGFFVFCLICGVKILKRDKLLGTFEIVLTIMSIYFNFYSAIMESDFCGYMMYILLAMPFSFDILNHKKECNANLNNSKEDVDVY